MTAHVLAHMIAHMTAQFSSHDSPYHCSHGLIMTAHLVTVCTEDRFSFIHILPVNQLVAVLQLKLSLSRMQQDSFVLLLPAASLEEDWFMIASRLIVVPLAGVLCADGLRNLKEHQEMINNAHAGILVLSLELLHTATESDWRRSDHGGFACRAVCVCCLSTYAC